MPEEHVQTEKTQEPLEKLAIIEYRKHNKLVIPDQQVQNYKII